MRATVLIALAAVLVSGASCAASSDVAPDKAPVGVEDAGSDSVRRGEMYVERELRQDELAAEDAYEEERSATMPELTDAERRAIQQRTERFLDEICRLVSSQSPSERGRFDSGVCTEPTSSNR